MAEEISKLSFPFLSSSAIYVDNFKKLHAAETEEEVEYIDRPVRMSELLSTLKSANYLNFDLRKIEDIEEAEGDDNKLYGKLGFISSPSSIKIHRFQDDDNVDHIVPDITTISEADFRFTSTDFWNESDFLEETDKSAMKNSMINRVNDLYSEFVGDNNSAVVKEINLLYNSQDLQGPEKSDLSDGENIIPNLSGEIGVTSIIDADTYTDTVNLYEVYDIVSNDYYGSAIISFCVNNESPISYSLSGQGSFDQFLSNTRSNLPTNGGYVFEIIGDATNGAVLRVRSIRPEVYECVFSEFTITKRS